MTVKLAIDLEAVLRLARLDAPLEAIVHGSTTSAAALARLRATGELDGAIRLGAFALPAREAVWWASTCAMQTAPPNQSPSQASMREAADAWVRKQDDATRRYAMTLAQRAGFNTPESWVAVAAFWSAGSMAPPDSPVVPPAPHLPGTAVAGAVALAAARGDPGARTQRLERFLLSLDDIAAGGGGRNLGPAPSRMVSETVPAICPSAIPGAVPG